MVVKQSPGVGLVGRYWRTIVVALAALAISVGFLCVVLRHTAFGLPIEDGYIYLTYAKQIGRGEPFTYFSGGGYSAGSTSVIWPMLLAPFWTLGARGDALVWVSFGLCSVLYAATAALVAAVVRRMFDTTTALVATCFALGVAPFAFTALSGMEVALASVLLIATIYQLLLRDTEARPSKLLIATLACLSLSRPESTLIVAGIIAVRFAQCLWRRDVRSSALWALPMVAPTAWLIANRTLAGNWFPNTGVAKSHFYLPGFDWTYWWGAVTTQSVAMLRALFWAHSSPLIWPRLIAVLWLVGAARVVRWASTEDKLLAGILMVVAPIALMFAVIGSSGAWAFHNYRYISPAFPLVMATAACALAPVRFQASASRALVVHRAWMAGSAACVIAFMISAYVPMRDDMDLYAQDATDLNLQVVRIGRYLHSQLPNAYVMFHDAGAIAYYGDTRVYDMLGLVTNHQARVANNGPGSRFEFLESLPPESRPTHFAYYPAWMGQSEFFGDVLMHTQLGPAFHRRRLIGDVDMELIVAKWDDVHTAEQPLNDDPGWRVVDRIDVADLQSEDAHGWKADLGRRHFQDPTARWSVVHKQSDAGHLLIDGGRTIRGGSERFKTTIDPHKPVRLVMRTGGAPSYGFNERITAPVPITLVDENGHELGSATLPAPQGRFVEIPFEIRSESPVVNVVTHARGPYRVFHWFVLQPS
jgi:hypothetical protein